MLGSIAAIIIAIWYYKSAQAVAMNPVKCTFMGLAVYFIPAIFWTFLVTPGLRDSVEHNQNVFLGFFVRYAYVAVGTGCAAWFHRRLFAKTDT